jgi:hypothetical protein
MSLNTDISDPDSTKLLWRSWIWEILEAGDEDAALKQLWSLMYGNRKHHKDGSEQLRSSSSTQDHGIPIAEVREHLHSNPIDD